MKGKLAIFCPTIGAPSESFIRRHLELMPASDVVVITEKILSPSQQTWSTELPVYQRQDLKNYDDRTFKSLRSPKKPYTLTNRDIKGLRRFLREHRVSVIWGHYLNRSWPYFEVAHKLGLKFYVHALGYDLSRLFREPDWKKRYADYAQASGIVVLNTLMRERLYSLGIPPEKIHIIPCGVDLPNSPLQRKISEKIRCLAVGRMVEKKAPLKLLAAFRQAAENNPKLHLDYAGEGRLYEEVVAYIERHDLGPRVTLYGNQPHNKIMALMQCTDLFLQHSITNPTTGDEEGMPVAILEAMAHGLPVISTLHTGIPEAVLDEGSGFLVMEGDVDRMAQKILLLAKNPQLRIEMGECGRRIIQGKFTCQSEREQLREVMALDKGGSFERLWRWIVKRNPKKVVS